MSYITAKSLFIGKSIELIKKYKFIEAILDRNSDIFVVHVAVLGFPKSVMSTHLLRTLLLGSLQQEKASVKVCKEYVEWSVVFLLNLVMKLPENTEINKHAIKLVKGKQSLYTLIYTISLIELKMLKTYIETHFKMELIRASKSSLRALILFHKKSNSS